MRGVLSALLWLSLLIYAAQITHDFYRDVDRLVYVSVDDGLGNEAYSLASQGRYGFLSSPILFGMERHHGDFSYGPFYFYFAGGLIWLFGYSLTLVRAIHLWVMLGAIVVSGFWFRGPGRAAAAAAFGLTALYAFAANQWPMIRPDSMVSLFAVLVVVFAGLGLTRGGARYWFAAGLAASCGAFTHLIAASLVASVLVLFGVAMVREWRDSVDRTSAQRRLGASFAGLAGGGLLGAFLFYASFGFRFADQWQLFSGYRALVASEDSYAATIGKHFGMAFGYLSSEGQAGVWALLIVAWLVVLSARFLSRDSRTLVYGYLLPPLAVWTGYLLANGSYSNQHKGYAVLHNVMMAWVAGSLVWLAISVAHARPSRWARAVPALLAALVIGQGIFLIEQRLAAAEARRALAMRWVPIQHFTDHVLRHVPARATAWGSLMFGIETPDRVQLIQVAEGLALMPRIDVSRRPSLAPDYLLWGYPEERDNTLIVFRGGDSLLSRFANLTAGARYRLASIVVAAPYGVTRVYARTKGEAGIQPPLPDVSMFDSDTQRWLSRLGPVMAVAFAPAPPAEFAIGYEREVPIARADRTVTANLPAGRYLLRISLTPGSGGGRRRLLAATSPAERRQQIGELGPAGDFSSYFAGDRQVLLTAVHGGGPLEVSQIDAGEGAAIASVEVFPVLPLLDPIETPGIHELPPPATWKATAGVKASVLPADGVAIEGDASQLGYQVISPRLAANPRDRVTLHLDMQVLAGRACLGVLNGDLATWLVSPDRPRSDVTFRLDGSRGFHVVAANCNSSESGNTPTRLTIAGGRFTVEASELYTDRFMNAVDVPAPRPEDIDLVGTMPGLLSSPAEMPVSRALLDSPLTAIASADMDFVAANVRAAGAGWNLAGNAEAAYSYVLQSKPQTFDSSTRLIVSGTVERGGITVGLQSRNVWAVQVHVTEPGPFTVVIAAPRPGPYSIVLANNLPASLESRIAVTALGLARAR